MGITQSMINAFNARLLNTGVYAVAAGASLVLDVRGLSNIQIIPAATADYEYSKVDSASASAHDTPTKIAVTDQSITSIAVTWPFYYITATTAALRVSAT